MKKWEYLEVLDDHQRRFVGHGLSSSVVDLGYDGWELVTVIPKQNKTPERWIFKKSRGSK